MSWCEWNNCIPCRWRQLIPTQHRYLTTKPHLVTFIRKHSSLSQPSEAQISITFNIYNLQSDVILCTNRRDRRVAPFWSPTSNLWKWEIPSAQLRVHKKLYLLRSVVTAFCHAHPAGTEATDRTSHSNIISIYSCASDIVSNILSISEKRSHCRMFLHQ